LEDLAAVVTEPFSEWILEGTFPAARPPWENAGARFVDDVGPYVRRKLRLLNGGHSLLAYLGGALGHRWVHEAAADPVVREALDALWGEAAAFMGDAGTTEYCGAVEDRWRNRRLPHSLGQIATDGATKLGERAVPTILAARAGGTDPSASAYLLGAWIAYLRGASVLTPTDSRLDELRPVATGPVARAVRVALGVLDDRLPEDTALCGEVEAAVEDVMLRAQAAGGASR
jgi:fructuronate reductase